MNILKEFKAAGTKATAIPEKKVPIQPPFLHHGIQVNEKDGLTVADAIEKCKLNFEVSKAPCMYYPELDKYKDDNGALQSQLIDQPFAVPNKHVTYRKDTGTPFAIVSDKYEVLSNQDIFGWIEPLLGNKDVAIVAGGQVNQGATVYLTLKFPDTIKIGGIDPVDKYVNVIGNHDATKAVYIMLSPVRLFCANQLNYAIQNAKESGTLSTVYHNRKAKENFDLAITELKLINTKYDQCFEAYNAMHHQSMKEEDLKEYLCRNVFSDREIQEFASKCGAQTLDLLFSNQRHVIDLLNISAEKNNMLQGIYNYYKTGFGQELIEGTLWGAYNAITGYYNNEKQYSDSHKRISSNMFGTVQKKTQYALDIALADYLN